MRLAVNIDHFATLRQARKSSEPDPVLVALLAEQAGAEGIVIHLRGDRRHIQERDLRLLREVVKTKLNLEMAASEEMKKIAIRVKPDVVSLVPERREELTTEGGLNVSAAKAHLAPFIRELQKAKIQVSIFVDPDPGQIKACAEVGVNLIEINTGKFADLKPGPSRNKAFHEIRDAAALGHSLGLEVHAGHGLDYRNVAEIVALAEIVELSIGFSIVARAAVVGVVQAVEEMKALLGKSGRENRGHERNF
jgi:pyridoxine 5-phosphate synthase